MCVEADGSYVGDVWRYGKGAFTYAENIGSQKALEKAGFLEWEKPSAES